MLKVPLAQFTLGRVMLKIVNETAVNLRKIIVSEHTLKNSVLWKYTNLLICFAYLLKFGVVFFSFLQWV